MPLRVFAYQGLFRVTLFTCLIITCFFFQMSDIVGYNIKPEDDSTLYQMIETGIGKHIEKWVFCFLFFSNLFCGIYILWNWVNTVGFSAASQKCWEQIKNVRRLLEVKIIIIKFFSSAIPIDQFLIQPSRYWKCFGGTVYCCLNLLLKRTLQRNGDV